MIFRKTLLAALLCTPAISLAAAAGAAGTGNLDIYYVDAEVENGGSTDGDGFGIKGSGKIADQVFLFGEYQNVEYDGFGDPEIEQIRAGGGFTFLKQQGLDAYGKAEFINVDGDVEEDSGFGVHAGLNFMPMPALSLTGQVGYIDVGDFGDGPEYLVGAAFNITPQIGVFTDYRYSDLEADGGGDFEVKDWRIGGRFNF